MTAFEPQPLAVTLADQRDLTALCAPRPIPTPEQEPYPWNAAYGHGPILKRYAGLPPDYKLKVALPHGVSYGTTSMFVAHESVAVLGYARPEERARYRAAGVHGRMWPVALPYVYLLDLVEAAPSERRGTIFFPPHSGPGSPITIDHARLVERLLALPPDKQPLTVCMYYEDLGFGHHAPYAEAGIPVVSAGHGYDPQFLVRLHHLCSTHEFAACSEVGSQVVYSIKSGCRWLRLHEPSLWEHHDPDEEAMFASLDGVDHRVQLRVADAYLGTAYRRTPAGLRRWLRHAQILDAAAVHEPGPDERPHVVVPYALRRRVGRIDTVRRLAGGVRRRRIGEQT